MLDYHIVDEPRPRKSEHLIVDPTIILFAAILIPIVLPLPYLANYWLPLMWCMVNAWLLRSPNWSKELVAVIVCVVGFLALIWCTAICQQFSWFDNQRRIWSYSRILQSALFFSIMYYIVLKQSSVYAIFKYTRETNV